MAKKATKRAAPKPPEKFIVIFSECGEDGQMELFFEDDPQKLIVRNSESAAKDALHGELEKVPITGTFYIAKIVCTGTVGKRVAWK